jgi:hypothetical protein
VKVAVYRTRSFGPSGVFTLPPGGAAPEHAFIPQVSEQRAMSEWTSKGHGVTWEEWARRLAGHLPYFDAWTVEDVPDGMTVGQALSKVREDETDRLLTSQG